MLDIQDVEISIRWADEIGLSDGEEPHEFVREISAKIYAKGGKGRVIGTVKLYAFDVLSAYDHDIEPFELYDLSEETVHYFDVFYGNGFSFHDQIESLFDEILEFGNLFIIDRLEILPKYRHCGLGLYVMKSLIKRLGTGMHAYAIKPFPLQFESSGNRQSGSLDFKNVTQKLVNYYSLLGFKAIPGTEFMVASPESFFYASEMLEQNLQDRSDQKK